MHTNPFDVLLQLPERPVPDRAEIVRGIPRLTRQTVMELDGPGCIRHVALVTRDPPRCGGEPRHDPAHLFR